LTRFEALTAGIGDWCATHPRRILAIWINILVASAIYSGDLPRRLKGGVGNVPGSGSWKVETALATNFDTPFAQSLVVVMKGADAHRRAPALAENLRLTEAVKRAEIWPTRPDEPAVLALGLDAATLEEAEILVKPIRALVSSGSAGAPGLEVLVTGQAAFGVDLNDIASRESSAGEGRVLPFTLLALVLAFGSLGAALAPLVAGLASVISAMGIIRGITDFMPLSVYASSITTMLGLGLGIDYALFVVSRIREEGGDVRGAIRHAAPFIAASAGTVVIGLAVMATVPVQDLIGLGVGGSVVALTSAAAGVTLLPALAALLGPWLDAPRLISSYLASPRRAERWRDRAAWVVAHRGRALVAAIALLAALALPIRAIDLGFPEVEQLPDQIETMRGWKALAALDSAGALTPVNILVEAPGEEPILTPARILDLAQVTDWLRNQPHVQEVRSVADFRRGGRHFATAVALGVSPQTLLPSAARPLVSRDGRATFIQVVLKSDATGRQKDAFNAAVAAYDWGAHRSLKGASVALGGLTALNQDLEDTAVRSLPRIAAFVVIATFLMLFGLTRSLLIPLKAVAANLLTVAAALGATIALFRSDWGSRSLGLDGPMLNVTPGIPILVFCVVFGLSMDYEVFLVSRILEAHREGRSDKEAVVVGLGATGGVITSAAVIMAIVFGGFALTDLIVIQMLGVALALGVLLDATVVRLLLIPSLMVFLGRFNWYPGRGAP
jgi:RND superfamily putative drug exporter